MSALIEASRHDHRVHQAIITPMDMYVPLVMQKVAKYRTWLFDGTASRILDSRPGQFGCAYNWNIATHAYPMAPTTLAPATKTPLLCILSAA